MSEVDMSDWVGELAMTSRGFLLALTLHFKSEVRGIITDKERDFILFSPGSNAGQKKCLAAFHTHLIDSALLLPKEDVVFTPPTVEDVYQVIVASVLGLYRMMFVVCYEGVYMLSPGDSAINRAKSELKALGVLESKDPWRFPAKTLFKEDGSFDHFELEKDIDKFPFMKGLLDSRPRWDFVDLREAIGYFMDKLKNIDVSLHFVSREDIASGK